MARLRLRSRDAGGMVVVVILCALVVVFARLKQPGGMTVAYRVTIDADHSAYPRVCTSIRIPKPVDSLRLDWFIQHDANALEVDSVIAPGGTPAPFRMETLAREELGIRYDFDRLCLGALPGGTLRIYHHVHIGEDEGDAHTIGRTGLRYGRATRGWVVTSLAQLLPVPRPAGRVQNLRVDYDLPGNWSVIASYSGPDLPRRLERGTFRDLFFAPVVLGHASVHRDDDLRLRIAVVGDDDTTPVQRVRRMYASALDAFGDVPRDPYLVVLVPLDAEAFGTQVDDTWFGLAADYEGATLVHGETVARQMLERLRTASGVDRPLVDPGDDWFVPAVLDQVAGRISAGEPDPLALTPLDDYVFMIKDAGDFPLDVPGPPADARRVKARAVAETLDDLVRANGADSLAAVLPWLAAREDTAALRALLEERFHCELDTFFTRYVRDIQPLPYPGVHLASPARGGDAPLKTLPPAVRDSIALVVVQDGRGYLERCGCKANQWGGIARAAAWLKGFKRRFDGPTVMLSAGNALPMDRTNVTLDSLSLGETALYLRFLREHGFETFAVGQSELFYGPDLPARLAREEGVTFVSANIDSNDVPGVVPWRLLTPGGHRIGFTALTARETHPLHEVLWAARTAGIPRRAPMPAVSAAADGLRDLGADFIIVAGKIKPAFARDLARTANGPLVIVSCEPVCKCVDDDERLHVNDASGFIGHSVVLYPEAGRYGLSVYTLYLGDDGTVVDFHEEEVYMTEDVPEDPDTRRALDRFYMTAARDFADATTADVTADPDAPRYVGADACTACHEDEHTQWAETSHARAFKTLLGRHRQYNPGCVQCHVTGMASAGGYRLGDMHSPMRGVQCEACHGPASAHVQTAGDTPLTTRPDAHTCKTCHTHDHSDMTPANFQNYYAKVTH